MKELTEEKKALTGKELKKVNGGICWPVKYGDDISEPWYKCAECERTFPKSLWLLGECCPYCGNRYFIPLS